MRKQNNEIESRGASAVNALVSTIALLLTVTTVSCTMDGSLSDDSENKIVRCKDTRDGEVFTYASDSVKNVRIGIGAPTTIEFVDMSGRERTMSTEDNKYWKCKEIKQ